MLARPCCPAPKGLQKAALGDSYTTTGDNKTESKGQHGSAGVGRSGALGAAAFSKLLAPAPVVQSTSLASLRPVLGFRCTRALEKHQSPLQALLNPEDFYCAEVTCLTSLKTVGLANPPSALALWKDPTL